MKKRNAIIVAIGVAFLLLGFAFLLIYCNIKGITLIDYLTGKWAMMFYVFLAVDIVGVGGYLVKDYIKRL